MLTVSHMDAASYMTVSSQKHIHILKNEVTDKFNFVSVPYKSWDVVKMETKSQSESWLMACSGVLIG